MGSENPIPSLHTGMVYWLAFVNHPNWSLLGRGTPTEKAAPSDWSAACLKGIFLINVGVEEPSPPWVGLPLGLGSRLYKEAAEQAKGSKSVTHSS